MTQRKRTQKKQNLQTSQITGNITDSIVRNAKEQCKQTLTNKNLTNISHQIDSGV